MESVYTLNQQQNSTLKFLNAKRINEWLEEVKTLVSYFIFAITISNCFTTQKPEKAICYLCKKKIFNIN